MRKSIGLYADTRNFKTTLPQTKHLNFFMQTNPQGYANGGQVRGGIPQNNMQVTSGFLPMALGFQEGGEAFSFGEIYGAIVKVVAGYLGKSEDDPQVIEESNKIAGTEEGQELAKKILTGQTVGPAGSGMTEAPLPTQTFEGSTQAEPPFGAVDVTPDPVMKPEPKITGQTPPGPAGSGIMPPSQGTGITSLPDAQPPMGAVDTQPKAVEPKQDKPELPFYLRPFDLNDDGVVDQKDLDIAVSQGLAIADAIAEFLGQKQPDEKKDLPKVTDEQKKREEEDTQKGMPKKDDVVPEIKPKPKPDSKGGIADFDVPDTEREYRKAAGLDDPANKQTPKEAKETSDDLAKLTGNKGKKDIPEWALPLASAGFAMMASKSPYFLQALGEAGQAGIATLQEQRGKKAAQRKTDAEIEALEARAAFDRGEGRTGKSSPTIITNDKGQRVYATFDAASNTFKPILKADGSPAIAVRSRQEIEEYLAGIYTNWPVMDATEKSRLVDEELAKDLGIANTNIASANQAAEEGGSSFDYGDFFRELFKFS